jgi:hypothetical protein
MIIKIQRVILGLPPPKRLKSSSHEKHVDEVLGCQHAYVDILSCRSLVHNNRNRPLALNLVFKIILFSIWKNLNKSHRTMNGMNGSNGADQPAGGQLNHHQLSFLWNAAGAGGGGGGHPNAALMASLLGGGGATGAGAPGFRGFLNGAGGGGGVGSGGAMNDGVATSLEDQILQRASALRAEALMQQHQQHQQQQQQHQQQQQQQHHQFEAALAALQQQQQQMSALGSLGGGMGGGQEQEALLARAAALREHGIAGGGTAAAVAALHGPGGLERLQQQLDFSSRLEEMERARRMQLAGLSGGVGLTGEAVGAARGNGVTSPILSAQAAAAATALRPEESNSNGDTHMALPAPKSGTKDARVSSSSPSSLPPTRKLKAKGKAPSLQNLAKTSANGADGISGATNVTSALNVSKDELRKTPGTVIVPCRGTKANERRE